MKNSVVAVLRAITITMMLAIPNFAFAQTAKQASPAGVAFFESKIRPILADSCYSCHSKTNGVSLSGLQLDNRERLLKGGVRGAMFNSKSLDQSLILKAVRYSDKSLLMPPAGKLSAEKIAALTEWVKMGSPYPVADASKPSPSSKFDLAARKKHWSWQPLRATVPPKVKNKSWVRNPIDAFVLAKLESKGLTPAQPADKRTLLRRVTFDLIGLPPTLAEISAFLADKSSNSYEKAVDRLLASPRYGERWGRKWLDLARYAETDGHEFDFDKPNAWRYRDYVIRALNADLPYNRFVTEQLAGDLLPNPRLHLTEGYNESILGTGFFWLGEGKHSPVELGADEAERIDNQIDVMSKTFLGLSLGCARCHNHKFDAISTKDYYALAGYLKSSRFHNADLLPQAKTIPILRRLEAVSSKFQIDFASATASELTERLQPAKQWMVAFDSLQNGTRLASDGAQPSQFAKWKEYLKGAALRDVNDLFHPYAVLSEGVQTPEAFKSRKELLIREMNEREKRIGEEQARSNIFADFSKQGFKGWFVSGEAFGVSPRSSQIISLKDGEPTLQFLNAPSADSGAVSSRLEGALRSPTFTVSKKLICFRMSGTGCEINLVIDGFQRIRDPIYGRLKIGINSSEQPVWAQMNVEKWIGHKAYIEILDGGTGRLALEKIVFSDMRSPEESPNALLKKELEDPAVTSVHVVADRCRKLLSDSLELWKTKPDSLPEGNREVVNWILKNRGLLPESVAKPASASLHGAFKQYEALESSLPAPIHAMTMTEGSLEDDRVHIRGSFKTLGDVVPRRFLEAIAGNGQPSPATGSGRLELANRMTSPNNPLLSRVIVNRLWQGHFGEGIVRSPDDFGVMGEAPTHPELLDWLAVNFIAKNIPPVVQSGKTGKIAQPKSPILAPCDWSLKSLHRLMVLSSAYRMSSRAMSVKLEETDPQNKLLHRMPVRRLEAEAIRDAVLSVSGRLNETMYGPGVFLNLTEYMEGRGRPQSGPLDGDGRRSVYLGVRRNFLSPLFLAFDYPIPFNTIGRRTVSNVPAQALALMNNPFILQQAELWAKRVLSEPATTPNERISKLYEAAFGRLPTLSESSGALAFVQSQPGAPGTPEELKQWSDLCHVLINVKEFIFVK